MPPSPLSMPSLSNKPIRHFITLLTSPSLSFVMGPLIPPQPGPRPAAPEAAPLLRAFPQWTPHLFLIRF